MIDSGAYGHVCPPGFAPQFPVDTESETIEAIAANKQGLKHYGQKHVDCYVEDDNGKYHAVTISFQVHDIKRVMLSTSRLKKMGFSTLFDAETEQGDKLVRGGLKFPLHEHGDHDWIRLHVRNRRFPGSARDLPTLDALEDDKEQQDLQDELFGDHAPEAAPGSGFPAGEEGQEAQGVGQSEEAVGFDIDVFREQFGQEGRSAKGVRIPDAPTSSQIEIHNLTHWPYRAWCGWCVKSRAVASPHFPVPASRKEERVQMMQIDWFFMRTVFEQNVLPCISGIECKSGGVLASVVPHKGASPYAESLILVTLEKFGLTGELILQVDAEHSSRDLVRRIAAKRKAKTIIRTTPKGSKQSLGYAEGVHRSIEGLSRTIKAQVESNCDVIILMENELTPWIIRHAATIITNFSVRSDGRTPHEHLFKTKYMSHMCMFGEAVWLRSDDPLVLGAKFTDNWTESIWLGRSHVDDRHIGATEAGVIMSRSCRRFPEGDRWNRDLLIVCKGVPWNKEGGEEQTFVEDRTPGLTWQPHLYRKAAKDIKAFWEKPVSYTHLTLPTKRIV